MSKRTVRRTPDPQMTPANWTYTWLFPVAPEDILQPIHRAEDNWEEWVRRKDTRLPPVFPSEFVGRRR